MEKKDMTKVVKSSGYRYGGRSKGTPNKDKATLAEKAKELGVDPFEVMLLFAKGDWKALGYEKEFIEKMGKDCVNYEYVIDPAVRAKMASEASQYLHAKRKSIEHSGTVGQEHSGAVSISPVKVSELVEMLKKVKSE